MICNQCGSFNPDHATFCGKCGGQLAHPSDIPTRQPLIGEPPRVGGEQYVHPSDIATSNLPRQTNAAKPKPMPVWLLIGGVVLVVLLLIVLQLTGSDWAAGALHAGIVAGILALALLVFTIVRVIMGKASKSNPARLIQLISSVLVILLLSLLCLVGLTQQFAIHNVQAHAWEARQQWQSAINQYQSSGEGAPTSEDIARIYNLWGEQYTARQQYVESLAKYNIVLTYYGSASTGIARAQSDSIAAYVAWGRQASQQHDYAAATNHYDDLLRLPYCAATCQSEASALDATAYYNLAESRLAAKDYATAINNFHTLVSRFASSKEAHTAHRDYAKSLLGEGEQQIKGAVCSSAVPTYQQLSAQFGDTPEGQQATSALKANQPVKGHFITTVPNASNLTPVATLIQGLNNNMSDSQFFQLLGASPTATIQSNGDFAFSPLPQGSYGLAWGTNQSDGTKHFQFAYNADGSAAYVAKVGPLCAFDFGNLNETIPTS